MSGDDRVRQACAYLRMLLVRPGEYRTAWELCATGPVTSRIDEVAVARVLGSVDLVPSVRDALDGRRLDATTLDRFVAAFGLRRTRSRPVMVSPPRS